MSKSKDLNLITQAKGGSSDAFCELYEQYKDRMFRYAFYRLGSDRDAEDAVSECFLSAWKQIGSLREEAAFGGWIFRILSGCCGSIIARQVEQRQNLPLEEGQGKPEPQAKVDTEKQVADRLALREALALLSEEDRNMVLLSVVAGFKSPEIARMLGFKAGTVRSRLSRALKKMRDHLEETSDEETVR